MEEETERLWELEVVDDCSKEIVFTVMWLGQFVGSQAVRSGFTSSA